MKAGLKQHLKNSKNDKVKAIERHCLQQMSLSTDEPLRAGETTLRNDRTLKQNDNRVSTDSSETDESDNDECDSDNAIDKGEEDDSSDVILAFINSDREDANERPNATRSGRAITRRSNRN